MRRIQNLALPRSVFDSKVVATPLQLEALLFLRMHPKSSVSALGDYLQLSSSAIAQLTDRLAKSNFIKRERNPADRRTVLLTLTAQGDKIFVRLHKVHMEKIKELVSLLPEQDMKDLIRIFTNLLQKLEGRKKK
jgi:DNA-binding MarR family transcriptional regulator